MFFKLSRYDMKKLGLGIIALFFLFLGNYTKASAHCDTMEGPVVADAKRAVEENNVNYVLKWVKSSEEKELKEVFGLTMKVRKLNQDAQSLADKYFFENLVRIHRAGEGVPYTGVKPPGTPIDTKIQAADKSIEVGNLHPLEKFVSKKHFPELEKRFKRVIALKNYDVNNVKAGREYVEAYVQFFHFAEGEAAEHNTHESHDSHGKEHH
jgi:hypothetical protein